MLTSQFFPAWYLMMRPKKRVILASYGADFAAEWGRKARAIVEEHGPSLYGVSMDRRSSKADRWDLAGLPGGMVTAGVGGGITGRGASLFIIDDPVKNAEEANSPAYQEMTWNWYTSTARTRMAPDGAIVLVMTRWNDLDLAGKLLTSEHAHIWEYLRLPAVAEDADDALGRKAGEALCPGLFPRDALEEIKGEVGSYVWAGMYQQRPAPPEGGIIKRAWFQSRRYRRDPKDPDKLLMSDGRVVTLHDCLVFSITDLAVSTKETADYTVISTFALTMDGRRDLILLNVKRSRMEGPDILPAIDSERKVWKAKFAGIETVAFQLSMVQQARRLGIPVREIPADKDKVVRAYAATPHMEAGKVWLPLEAHYLADFEAEIFSFPNATHDDQTDTLTYACAFAQGQAIGNVPKAREPRPVDDRSPISENLTNRAASPFNGR